MTRAGAARADVRLHVALLAALSAAVTIAFVVSPSLRLGYRAAGVHVALETAAALVALFAAFLAFGRLARTPTLATLLLSCGLGALATTNFGLSVLPWLLHELRYNVALWAAVGGRLAATVLIAASAFAPRRDLYRRPGSLVVAVSVLLCVVPFVVFWLLRSHVPLIATGLATSDPRHLDLHAHPAYLTIQAIDATLYATAAVGFGRKAAQTGDEFLRLLAIACVFAAASRVNYLLYPSIYTDWVYVGDVFRLAFFAVLLAAALREIAGYWRVAASMAVADERTRLARDLHDGLAQELAFLRSALPGMADDPSLPARVLAAAERAEHESRQLLSALTAPADSGIDALLARRLSHVAEREQVRLNLETAPQVQLDHARADALVRIAVEAVTNAARHGRAHEVHVRLEPLGDRVRLAVRDEGVGFDPESIARDRGDGTGFGLASMRSRATAIGADFVVASRPGAGTEVIVIA